MQAPTSLASGMSSQSGNVMTGIGQPTTLPVGPGLQVIAGVTHPQAANEQISPTQVQRWIQSVGHCMDDREIALGELSKKREAIPDLATMLWCVCVPAFEPVQAVPVPVQVITSTSTI